MKLDSNFPSSSAPIAGPSSSGAVSARLTPITTQRTSFGTAFNIEELQQNSAIQPQESPLAISRDEERFFTELFPSPSELRQSAGFNRNGQLQAGITKGRYVDARV